MAVNRVAVSDRFEGPAGASATGITGWWTGFLSPLIFTGLLLLLLASPRPSAGAQLGLSSGQAEKGEQATFTLSVNQAPRTLNAFMLDIAYDVNVLRFSGFAPGELARDGYSLFRVFNHSPGVIRIGGVEPQEPGVRKGDSGDLVHLTFNVIQEGESPLTLTALTNDVQGWTTRNGHFAALSVDPADKTSQAPELENPGQEVDGIPVVDSAGAVASALSRSGGAPGYGNAPETGAVDDNGEPVNTASTEKPVADDQGEPVLRQNSAAGTMQAPVERQSARGSSSAQTIGSGKALPAGRQSVNPAGRIGPVPAEGPEKSLLQDRLTGIRSKAAAGTAGRQSGDQQPLSAFGGDRLFEVAARVVEIVLLAAILMVLLMILREMRSQRAKIKIFPGSSGLPASDSPTRPEIRSTGTGPNRHTLSSRIFRFTG
ncbi:cohesin domain-containing protein [Desulfosudis oleivorans]|uniref:Cohesin domain-containing protein n=1 Tax=Desulfosudis oleivorans (strain DSM 6200 / JCM 39069 / Hxd3) TaxID=96561 RepID=A9A0P7_DESOH|nr:cohesin domain-containing protein [Desulfosudis oleivorans]ABW69064.1 hypothetical protein Dole_3261 [Desulfosudis oleivorans Hxd3]